MNQVPQMIKTLQMMLKSVTKALHSLHALVLVLVGLLILVACANIGTPDGGPYDETPPKIVHTSPKFAATKSKAKKIVLELDENIKLDNPMEKVVVSPPQLNMPEISSSGKRITVELEDTLIPNTTYTIDFADAIEDNNEGNPMGDYAFTFSTGETIDTFQVSGYVLNAQDLEPIKGIVVGLYALDADSTMSDAEADKTLADSVFRTKPFERISRTDSRGQFVIKGLNKDTRYRVFALKDVDFDYRFSQKAEMIAFSHRVVQSSCNPDTRFDTLWHDSIHFISVDTIPYTHFYPDDIMMLAFQEAGQNRAFLKSERPQLEKFTLYFTAPDDSLPRIEGLNFSADSAFVIDKTPKNDTITYWIRDSLIYNNDTLSFVMTFNATDTLGQLVSTTDTLHLFSKVSYEKTQKRKADEYEAYRKDYIKEYKKEQRRKKHDEGKDEEDNKKEEVDVEAEAAEEAELTDQPETPEDTEKTETDNGKDSKSKKKKKKKKDADEDIVVPPMPEKFLEVKSMKTSLNPDQNVDISFDVPIDTFYRDMFHFSEIIDSLKEERPFVLRRIPGKVNTLRFYAEWTPGTKYELVADTGAIISIFDKRWDGMKKTISVKPLEEFSTLFVSLQNTDTTAIVQLLNTSDKVVKETKVKNSKADFYFLQPGTYYLRMFYDRNGDGVWTTGDYDSQTQAEQTFYYSGALNLRAQWEVTQTWNPLATPISKQKPAKITQQKPDKEKTIKNRNAERTKNGGSKAQSNRNVNRSAFPDTY